MASDAQRQLIWRSSADRNVATVDRHRSLAGLLAGLLAATIVVLAACSSSTPPAVGSAPSASSPSSPSSAPGPSAPVADGTRRTSDGGQVTVVVDWAGPAAGAIFEVQLDTHSVDLDALDLSSAILRNSRGETMSAKPWGAPKGGHHREGALAFDGDATPFFAGASWVELVLSGVGDLAERSLRWDINA